jgi:hypothetical protein
VIPAAQHRAISTLARKTNHMVVYSNPADNSNQPKTG